MSILLERKRLEKLAGLITETIDEQDQIDEGFKEALIGAIMSISALSSAKAADVADSIKADFSKSKIETLIDDKKELSDVIKSYTAETSDIQTVDIQKPVGYKPLSVEHRLAWNSYLDFLGDKAGSSKLDLGAPETNGMKELKSYLKQNPTSKLNDFKSPVDLVKSVQYEMNLLRKGKSFQDLSPIQLRSIQTLLLKDRPKFMTINTSKEDGNPGQFTTQERYPVFGNSVDYSNPSTMKKVYNTLSMIYKINSISGQSIAK